MPSPPHAYLTTPKGRFTAFAGDWIITAPTGEQHVCQDSLFRQTYQQLADAEPREESVADALLSPDAHR